MKKGWKTALIISGIVGGIGIGCCIAAVVLGVSWKEFRPYFFPHVSWLHKEEVSSPSSEDKMKTLGTYKGIGKLSIQVSSMKTYFQIDENLRGEIRIQGENLDDRTGVDIRQDKEELSVDSSSHKIFGGFLDNTNSALWIYLPQDFRLEETSIDVGAGSVYAEQILSKKMEIDVGAGAVEMDQFKAEEIDIDCGAGGVTMLGGNAPEKVLIDCGAGGVSVEFSGCSRQYDYDLDCSAGSISIDREEQIAGFGGKRKIDNNAQKKVKADCAAGGIELTFVQ